MVFLNQISATRIKICQWRKSNSLKKGQNKKPIYYSLLNYYRLLCIQKIYQAMTLTITIACFVYRRSTRLWHWQLLSLTLYTEGLPGYDIDNYYRLVCIQKAWWQCSLSTCCLLYMCTKTGIDMLQFHSSIKKYEFYRHTIFFVFHIFAAICLTMCPQVLRCYETLYTFCSDQSTTGMSSYTKNWNITASSFILVNQTFHTCWSSLYFLSASPLFMKATPAANEFSICSAHLQSIGEIILY